MSLKEEKKKKEMQGVKQSWENSLQTPKIAKIYIFRTLWKWLLQGLLFLKQKMQAYHLALFLQINVLR